MRSAECRLVAIIARANVSTYVNFYPRDAMLARYLLSSHVCPFVFLSQAGIASKRLNLGSQKEPRTIAQGPDLQKKS